MKSTGEVMGIDYDFGRAYYKASIAAHNRLPKSGNVFISVTDDLKDQILKVAKTFVENGLSIYATSGTVEFFAEQGVTANLVRKIAEGSPNVLDMLRAGEISLIINNFADKQSRHDHEQIMRIAVDYGIPYITTVQAAVAAAEAINSVKEENLTIEPLQHYLCS
jgi:carbamoyl-phosphate synthase large subunit